MCRPLNNQVHTFWYQLYGTSTLPSVLYFIRVSGCGQAQMITFVFWFYSWFICFCATSHYDVALDNKRLVYGSVPGVSWCTPKEQLVSQRTTPKVSLGADRAPAIKTPPRPIRLCIQFFRIPSFILFYFCFALHCEELKNVLCSLRHWQGRGGIILCCLPLLIQWYLVSLWRKRGGRYREKWGNCSTFPSFCLAILSQIRSRVLHLSCVIQRGTFG